MHRRRLVKATPRQSDDEETRVENLESILTRDQIDLAIRTSVAEAILPLDRRLASIAEMVTALATSLRLLAANEEARAARFFSDAAVRPAAPAPMASAPTTSAPMAPPPMASAWGVASAATTPMMTSRALASRPAAYDAFDPIIDGAFDGVRRRRRVAIAATIILVVVFGALFLALGMSYMAAI